MAFTARATLETLGIILVVFVLQRAFALVSVALMAALFVLQNPLVQPWTLVTSVYAHGSLGHLASNSIALVVFGLAVERVTTRRRFHAFFVTVGALSGATQVLFQWLVGSSAGVLGASGAVFGLLGYLVAGNTVADTVVAGFELDARAQLAAIGVVAAAVALATAAPGIAVIGHFAGLLLGLLAGRTRLLHVD